MADNKTPLTDAEIKKALVCCVNGFGCHIGCPLNQYAGSCSVFLTKSALDLINRLEANKEALIAGQETLQKSLAEKNAEIEYLKLEYAGFEAATKQIIKTIKAEAIKRFAERLKEKSFAIGTLRGEQMVSRYVVDKKAIDNLVKEMVGE